MRLVFIPAHSFENARLRKFKQIQIYKNIYKHKCMKYIFPGDKTAQLSRAGAGRGEGSALLLVYLLSLALVFSPY